MPSLNTPPRRKKARSPLREPGSLFPLHTSFSGGGEGILATSYFRTTLRRTIIGAAAFHFRVRNGNGWGHCAMITRGTRGRELLLRLTPGAGSGDFSPFVASDFFKELAWEKRTSLTSRRFSDIYIQVVQHNFGAMGCLRPIHSLFPLLGSALSFVLLLDQKCQSRSFLALPMVGQERRKKTKPNG